MYWCSTLLIAGVVLLVGVATALIIRRTDGHRTLPTLLLMGLLVYARYPLYLLSGLLAGRAGTWVDGALAGLVVASVDSSLGWALSAAILRPLLLPKPRTWFLSNGLPLAILVVITVGPLCGTLGAMIGFLWP